MESYFIWLEAFNRLNVARVQESAAVVNMYINDLDYNIVNNIVKLQLHQNN